MALYHSKSPLVGVDGEDYNESITPTNADVIKYDIVKLIPLSADVNSSVLHFQYSGSSIYYIDLARTFLYLQCQILDENDEEIELTEKILPVPNPLSSIWNSRKVTISNEIIYTGDCYSYMAYIRDVLSLRSSTKNSLAMGTNFYYELGFNLDPVSKKFNASKSRKFSVYGNLDIQPFTISKLLAPNTTLRFEFKRNPDAFVLLDIKENSTAKPKLKVLEAKLELTCLLPNAKLRATIERNLVNDKNLIYSFIRSDMNSYVLQKGIQTVQTVPLSSGPLPFRVLIFLVEQERFIGEYNLFPYKFEPHFVNKISLLLDGHPLTEELEVTSFEKKQDLNTDAIKLYYRLFKVVGQDQKENCGLTYEQFISEFCCFAFDLTPSQTAYKIKEASLQPTGDISIKISFSKPLGKNVMLLMYAEYNSTMEYNKFKELTLGYN